MSTTKELPFQLTNAGINAWLLQLKQSELTYASNELYKVLKSVNKQSPATEELFLLVQHITGATLQFSRDLELLCLSISGESQVKNRKLLKLNTNLMRYLALSYVSLSEQEQEPGRLTLCISRALQLSGLTLRLSAMAHDRHSSFLWQKMSDLYQISFSKNLLDHATGETLPELNKFRTINSILKRNLLFSICNPNNFTALEINKLFETIDIHCDMLVLKTLYSIDTASANFYWLYMAQNAPQLMQPNKNEKTILHLNTSELVTFFQSSKFKIPFANFSHVITRLSKYQDIINSVVISEPIIGNLITGFEETCAALRKPAKPQHEKQQSPLLALAGDSDLDHVQIEPFNNEYQFPGGKPKSIWQQDENGDKSQIVKIQRASHNFCIAEMTELNNGLNEPVLLYTRDLNMTLGIIRQIQQPVIAGQKTYRILIEKWDGNISCVKSNTENIILIEKSKRPSEVLLLLNKYASGSKIHTPKGEIQLQNLREENCNFMHFEISPPV